MTCSKESLDLYTRGSEVREHGFDAFFIDDTNPFRGDA